MPIIKYFYIYHIEFQPLSLDSRSKSISLTTAHSIAARCLRKSKIVITTLYKFIIPSTMIQNKDQ